MTAKSVLAVAWVGLLFGILAPPSAHALGRRPTKPPTEVLPASHAIAGFDVARDGLAFPNYGHWNHSHLPEFLQLFHCAGMALFVRQVFNWGQFDPSLPKLTLRQYKAVLKKIYNVPTSMPPGTRPRIVIPGYADFNELSGDADLAGVVKDILKNAIGDILKPNWNWSVFDVFGSTPKLRRLIELSLRESVAKDRVSLLYIMDHTKQAHAVLLYGYEVRGEDVVYSIYDSNHPGVPWSLTVRGNDVKFVHGDWGPRDPWILHPYGDEFRSTKEYLEAQREP